MLGRDKLGADQAWTLERKVRQQMKRKGVAPRDAARVAERVRAEQLGVSKDDVARLEAAALKRARKAGRVLPQGHSGVPVPAAPMEARVFFNGGELGEGTIELANRVGDESDDGVAESDPGSAES